MLSVNARSPKANTTIIQNVSKPEPIMSLALQDCFGHICHPVEEFCSTFTEGCMQCSQICDLNSETNQAEICSKECTGRF